MKRHLAIAIATVTLLPYATAATGFWFLSHGHGDSSFFGNKSNGFFGPFEFLLLGAWALSLAIYSIHLQRNREIEKADKEKWLMRIWVLQIFAIAPYWYRFIWPQGRAAKPCVGPRPPQL